MAASFLVTVNGVAFATVTTEPNAIQLRNKINKVVGRDVAAIAAAPLLFNPKHVDALAALAAQAATLGIGPDLHMP